MSRWSVFSGKRIRHRWRRWRSGMGCRSRRLRLAEAFRVAGSDGRPAAEEAAGGGGSRDRGDEGDHAGKILGVSERCRAVVHVVNRGLSQRRSCALIGVARSALGYESVMAAKDAPAVSAMQALATQYPRYGYRRIRSFLRREGHAMSVGRLPRLSGSNRRFRCRASGHGGGWRRVVAARSHRHRGITSGCMTSCSTPAPMASSSSA